MSYRISKISTQVGISSATVLLSLAMGTVVNHPSVLASDDQPVTVNSPQAQTKLITRLIKVIDPYSTKPIQYQQTVQFRKVAGQWQPVSDNYWAPLFMKQYENYEPDRLYIPAKLVDAQQPSETLTIRYHEVKIPDRYRLLSETVSVWSRPNGRSHLSDVRGKIGEWVAFPKAPTGFQYAVQHPDKIHLISPQPIQILHMPLLTIKDNSETESKVLTREITFKLPTGDQTVVQRATARRNKIVMPDQSGMVHWTPWTIVQTAEVTVPQVAGYVSSLVKIPDLTVDSEQDIQPLVVTYQKQSDDQHSDAADQDNSHVDDTNGAIQDKDLQTDSATGETEKIPPVESNQDTTKADHDQSTNKVSSDNKTKDEQKEQVKNPVNDAVDKDVHSHDQLENQPEADQNFIHPDDVNDHANVIEEPPVSTAHKDDENQKKQRDEHHQPENSISEQKKNPNQSTTDLVNNVQEQHLNQSMKDPVMKHPGTLVAGQGKKSTQIESAESTKPIDNDELDFGEIQASLDRDHNRLRQLSNGHQDQLPQTGNRVSTISSLMGMLVTLLAGFISGATLKRYYRRVDRHQVKQKS